MVQNIVVKDTRQRLLTVLIQPQRGSGNLVMNLVLPHGLDFTKGVTAKVDEKDPIQLAIRTSDQQGAYAGLTISQELLADLRGGDEMKFTYQAMNGRAFNLGVSLAGFTAAQKKLVSN